MIPADLTAIERRLRDAFSDAAAVVQQQDLAPDVQARPAARPGRRRRRRILLVPLAAAAAVLLIAIAPFAVSRSLNSGPQRGPALPEPRYLVAIPRVNPNLLDVRSAATGALSATIRIPIRWGSWYALAAQGPQTFIASEGVISLSSSSPTVSSTSYLYRFVIGRHGTVTSIGRVGRAVNGIVMAASITPDGRYIGYVLTTPYGFYGEHARVRVVLANVASGRAVASWPVPDDDSIASLSIDADGNALAASAYDYYRYPPSENNQNEPARADLAQWTSVLRPATSGTAINKVPRLLPQAGTLALSADGRRLYEFLQTGNVTSRSWQDRDPVAFNLAVVNTSNGSVVSVLHTWQAVWKDFVPQLALDPAAGYLLITDGTRLATVNAVTGRYAAVPGRIPLEQNWVKFPLGQGGDIDPVAW
jgi:hypothetical protein